MLDRLQEKRKTTEKYFPPSEGYSRPTASVSFNPRNRPKQKLAHLISKAQREKQNNVIYVIQCNQECSDLYQTTPPQNKDKAKKN